MNRMPKPMAMAKGTSAVHVSATCPFPAAPDHAADALAVAVCHLNRAPLAAALARA